MPGLGRRAPLAERFAPCNLPCLARLRVNRLWPLQAALKTFLTIAMLGAILLAAAAPAAPRLSTPRAEVRAVAVARARIVGAARIDFAKEARRTRDPKRVLIEFE